MPKAVKDMTPEELYVEYRTGTPERRDAADKEIERQRVEKLKRQEQNKKNKAAQDLNMK